jgi:hypothetical protein
MNQGIVWTITIAQPHHIIFPMNHIPVTPMISMPNSNQVQVVSSISYSFQQTGSESPGMIVDHGWKVSD